MKTVVGLVLSCMLCSCGEVKEPYAVDQTEADPLKEYLIEAVAQIRNRNYDSARLNLRFADSLAQVLQNQYARSSVLSNYGLIWSRQNQYDSAIYYYKQSLAIDLELNDTSSIIKHSNDLGKNYRALSYFGEATVHHERALKMALLRMDSANIAFSSNSLGSVLVELKDFESALLYYNSATRYWQSLGHWRNFAVGLQNKGTTLLEMDSVVRAISVLEKSRSIKDTVGNQSSQAYTLASLGAAYLKAGSLLKAEKVLNEALALRLGGEDKAAIAETELRLSRLGLLRRDFIRAEKLLKKVEKTAITLIKPDLRRDALEVKKDLYWQWGKYRLYGLIDREFDILNDSIYQEQRLKVLQAQSESRIETEVQKTQLAEQNARLSSLETEVEKGRSSRRLQLLLVIGFALLVIIWQLRLIASRNKSLVALNTRIKLITDNAFHSQANAMGLLSSLMRSQSRQLKSAEEKALMDMVNQKIDAMTVLSRQIFRTRLEDTEGLAEKIELSSYLYSLAHETVATMPGKVNLVLGSDEIYVVPKIALNLGLVTNELITNTFKYAVPQGASYIKMSASVRAGELNISYQDDGPGFNQQQQNKSTSFGTKMISILIEKDLDGKIDFESSSSGVTYTFKLRV